MPRKCVVCGVLHSINLPVFAFPKSAYQRRTWIAAIQQIIPSFSDPIVDDLGTNKHSGVCERHFDSQDIKRGKKASLHPTAIPLVSSGHSSNGADASGVKSLTVHFPITDSEKTRAHFLMEDEDDGFRSASMGHMSIEGRTGSGNWQVDDDEAKDPETCLSIDIEDYLQSEPAYGDETSEDIGNHGFVFSKKERSEMDVCLVCGKQDKNSNLICILGVDDHSSNVSASLLLSKIVCRSKREVLSVSMMMCSRCENLVQEVALIEEDLKFKKHRLKSMFDTTFQKFKEKTKVTVGSSMSHAKPTDLYAFDTNCSRSLVLNSSLGDRKEDKNDSHLEGKLSERVRKSSRRQASTKKYCCPQCPEVYSSLALWVQHLSKHSDTEELKTQTNTRQVITKIKKHKVGLHACEECGKNFYCKQTLLAHASAHQKVSECSVCGRFLTTKARLKAHLFKFHGIGETKLKEFACEDCEKCFGTKAGLRYHRNVVHHVGPKYVCKHCNKTFYYHVPYRSHLLYAHGEKKIVCETCGEKFFTISKLNTHINAVHRGAHSWTCNECDSKFTTYTAYRHHMNVKHRKMQHTCEYCNQQYRKQSSLLIHLWKHSVFICQFCKDNFSCNDALRTHMSVAHGKDMNWKSKRKHTASLIQEKKLVVGENVLPKTSPGPDDQIEQNEHVASIVINDLLMTAESYDNSSLQPFSLSACEKLPEKHSHNTDEDIKVKTLSIINASQDLQTIDPLQFGAVETLEVKSSHDHIEMAPEVSLINVQILGDMEISQSDTLGDLKSSMLAEAAHHLTHDDQLDNKDNIAGHLTVDTHLSVARDLEHSGHSLEAANHLEAACHLEATDHIETCHLDTGSHLSAESALEVSNKLESPHHLNTTNPHLEVPSHIETSHLDGTDLSDAGHLDADTSMTVTSHLESSSHLEAASHLESTKPLPISSHIEDSSNLDSPHHLEAADQCPLPPIISQMQDEVESVSTPMIAQLNSKLHNLASDMNTHSVERAETSMGKEASRCMIEEPEVQVADENLDKQIEKMDEVELQPFTVTLDGKGEVQYQYVMYISAAGEDGNPG